jgi:hypothetical protein
LRLARFDWDGRRQRARDLVFTRRLLVVLVPVLGLVLVLLVLLVLLLRRLRRREAGTWSFHVYEVVQVHRLGLRQSLL